MSCAKRNASRPGRGDPYSDSWMPAVSGTDTVDGTPARSITRSSGCDGSMCTQARCQSSRPSISWPFARVMRSPVRSPARAAGDPASTLAAVIPPASKCGDEADGRDPQEIGAEQQADIARSRRRRGPRRTRGSLRGAAAGGEPGSGDRRGPRARSWLHLVVCWLSDLPGITSAQGGSFSRLPGIGKGARIVACQTVLQASARWAGTNRAAAVVRRRCSVAVARADSAVTERCVQL